MMMRSFLCLTLCCLAFLGGLGLGAVVATRIMGALTP